MWRWEEEERGADRMWKRRGGGRVGLHPREEGQVELIERRRGEGELSGVSEKKQRCDFWSSNKCVLWGNTRNIQWGKLGGGETMMFCLVVVVVVVDR